jgi:acyl-CoA synthetase (AMP-forming)/AMP-acid ligase II
VILHSPLPDLTIPETDFSTFALARGRSRPETVVMIEGETGARMTYGEFIGLVDATAGGLRARGFELGDALAMCAFNTPDYGVVAHAVWRLGGVVVTMNPLFTPREMEEELRDARPKVLVAAPEVLERAGSAARDAGIDTVLSLPEFLRLADAPPPPPRVEPASQTALILYSSGTTGLPKGVMLTHRNLITALLQHESGDLARADDVLLALSPFFHVVGLGGILNLGVYTGAAIVTLRRYSLETLLELIQRERISSVFLTPPVVLDLTKNPVVDQYDVSSLRSLLCAAAPLGAELEQAAADRLGCMVRQGYGMTEATGPITTTLGDRLRRGAVGHLVPNTELKIADLADGHELEADQVGEILVRGPQVMLGYLNQPAATAATLEPDGWLHTGDVGSFDADGYLHVVDRVKEIIKYNAYQVAPAELEAVLIGHPQVADVAVVPSPDEHAGEVPKAFVVRQPGATVTADELMAWVAEQVAPYKKVRRLDFVDSIPKSPSGKILRRVLVEAERERARA